MMKVLFAVDSVFQLMIAVNLRLTMYKDCKSDIIVYDSTLNADEICNKLNKTGAFDKCYYAKTPLTYCGDKYSFIKKFPKYFVYLHSLINPKKCITNILGDSLGVYDQFLFNGVGALTECIYNVCKRNNASLVCYRFEDSYLSYIQEYGSKKSSIRINLEKIAAKLCSRKNIEDDIKGYYFATPDLVKYKFNYPILQSPKFSRNNLQLTQILNKTFDFNASSDDYKEKYIFFECGDAFFFGNNEDLDFVKKLSEVVGGENILIKRHPRIENNRFQNLDVHISKELSVPWELIQMNVPLDGKVFITTKSAAALTSEVYFGDKCSVILLYKGIKGNQGDIGENMEKYMSSFKLYSNNDLWFPKSLEEFEMIIRKIEM